MASRPPSSTEATRRARWASVIDRLHVRLFGHPPSPMMLGFLGNLTTSMVWGIVGAACALTTTVVAGRLLGAAEYGVAALALVVASIVLSLCALGLDAGSTRMVATAADDHGRSRAVTATVAVNGVLIVLVAAVGIASSAVIGEALGADALVVRVGILLGCVYAIRFFIDKLAAALGRFAQQARARVTEGALGLLVFTALAVSTSETWQTLITALGAASVVFILMMGSSLRSMVAPRGIERAKVLELARYARWGVLGTVAPMVVAYGDKVVVQAVLGPAALGQYMAYSMLSLVALNQLLALVSNVLMPAIARAPDRRPVVAKLLRLCALAFVPLAATMFVVTLLTIKLFGPSFYGGALLTMSFAIYSSLFLINGLIRNVVLMHSERTYALTVIFQALRSVLFAAMIGVGIVTDTLTLEYVVIALVVTEILEVWNLRRIAHVHITASSGAPAPTEALDQW